MRLCIEYHLRGVFLIPFSPCNHADRAPLRWASGIRRDVCGLRCGALYARDMQPRSRTDAQAPNRTSPGSRAQTRRAPAQPLPDAMTQGIGLHRSIFTCMQIAGSVRDFASTRKSVLAWHTSRRPTAASERQCKRLCRREHSAGAQANIVPSSDCRVRLSKAHRPAVERLQ